MPLTIINELQRLVKFTVVLGSVATYLVLTTPAVRELYTIILTCAVWG